VKRSSRFFLPHSPLSSNPGTPLGHAWATLWPAGADGQHRKPSNTAGHRPGSARRRRERVRKGILIVQRVKWEKKATGSNFGRIFPFGFIFSLCSPCGSSMDSWHWRLNSVCAFICKVREQKSISVHQQIVEIQHKCVRTLN